jgi:hypothetical protein
VVSSERAARFVERLKNSSLTDWVAQQILVGYKPATITLRTDLLNTLAMEREMGYSVIWESTEGMWVALVQPSHRHVGL